MTHPRAKSPRMAGPGRAGVGKGGYGAGRFALKQPGARHIRAEAPRLAELRHEAAADSVLFSFPDRPIQQAPRLFREDRGTAGPVKRGGTRAGGAQDQGEATRTG